MGQSAHCGGSNSSPPLPLRLSFNLRSTGSNHLPSGRGGNSAPLSTLFSPQILSSPLNQTSAVVNHLVSGWSQHQQQFTFLPPAVTGNRVPPPSPHNPNSHSTSPLPSDYLPAPISLTGFSSLIPTPFLLSSPSSPILEHQVRVSCCWHL